MKREDIEKEGLEDNDNQTIANIMLSLDGDEVAELYEKVREIFNGEYSNSAVANTCIYVLAQISIKNPKFNKNVFGFLLQFHKNFVTGQWQD